MNAMVSRILMAIFIIVLGVLRYNGKSFTRRELSIIHRNKVTDENKLLYGKQSGKAMLILGITFILGSGIFELYNDTIDSVILVVGLITYIGMYLSAHYKYINRKY